MIQIEQKPLMNSEHHHCRRIQRIAMLKPTVFIFSIFWLCEGLSLNRQVDRRFFLEVSPVLIASPASSFAALPPASRDVEVGGGYDLLSQKRGAADEDVIYPKSMEGRWNCVRTVARVEGDKFQAGEAYRCLGGNPSLLKEGSSESFETQYIGSPVIQIPGVVVDRGFEASSRATTKDVQWDVATPNVLEFNKVKIVVVKRSVEIPSDKGFGFDELLRVEDGTTTRAVQIKRRYRRAFDEQGNRIVEGLEILKTFRVLDGIAGTEYPTSTVKSQIRLARPPS